MKQLVAGKIRDALREHGSLRPTFPIDILRRNR